MISYSASGNSRVILNENEEIIEILVYDRLSENEKCELYVWYRSKKNADGSWHISEAEILDIFCLLYTSSAMGRVEDIINAAKTNEMLSELLHIKKEEEKKQNVLMWVLIVVAAVAAVAGIAYAVYRFFTPDYLEDFDEDFDDDYDDDFFDDRCV